MNTITNTEPIRNKRPPILVLGDELNMIAVSSLKNPRIKLLKMSDTTGREVWVYLYLDEVRDLIEVLKATGVAI